MRSGGPHVASVVHRQGLLTPALGAIERIAVAAFIVRQVMGVRAAVPRSWWRGIQTLSGVGEADPIFVAMGAADRIGGCLT